MIRRKLTCTEADFAAAGLGEGVLKLKHILNGPEELFGAGRIFADTSLPVGAWIGPHVHKGESEIYYYIEGTGEYYDDGKTVSVEPGCMTQVRAGHQHGLKNTGTVPLRYICLILNEQEQ